MQNLGEFTVGNSYHSVFTQLQLDGTPFNSPTLTVKVTDPHGNITQHLVGSAYITKVQDGIFSADTPITMAGTWTIDWFTTDALPARQVGYLTAK